MKAPTLTVGQKIKVQFESGNTLTGTVRWIAGSKCIARFMEHRPTEMFESVVQWANWFGKTYSWKEDAHTPEESILAESVQTKYWLVVQDFVDAVVGPFASEAAARAHYSWLKTKDVGAGIVGVYTEIPALHKDAAVFTELEDREQIASAF